MYVTYIYNIILFNIVKFYDVNRDNYVLYKKLFDIDKNGHKKAVKKMKPIFQYTKTTMAGNKKHEIIRVAQENLYMLKRLNERTSVYNVDKWNRDYEISQYYKRSHCQYPSIDFYKTQRCGSLGNMFTGVSKNSTKKNFYYKTQYSGSTSGNNNKKRKRFEDFSYRDLQIGTRSKSEIGDKEEPQFKNVFDNNQEEKQENEEEKQIEIHKDDNNNQNKQDYEKEEIKEEKKDLKEEEKNELKEEEKNELKEEEKNELKEEDKKELKEEDKKENIEENDKEKE